MLDNRAALLDNVAVRNNIAWSYFVR